MSREYKFRAWDEKHGLMYSIISINFSDNVATGVTNGEWYEFDIENIMQFTGRKDINNIEIYEGDIIVMNDYPFYGNAEVITDSNKQCDELNYVGVVEWDDYIGYFLNLKPVSNRVRGGACGSTLQYYDDMLVIGNISENPELLEYR